MTFKVCNFSSEQPYFNRAYVVRVDFFFATNLHMSMGRIGYLDIVSTIYLISFPLFIDVADLHYLHRDLITYNH